MAKHPDTITVDLKVDLSGITRAFTEVAEAMRLTTAQVNYALARAAQHQNLAALKAEVERLKLQRARRLEVRTAGLEARYYVRAAMAPEYAGRGQVAMLLVRLACGEEREVRGLSERERQAVACSAYQGWLSRGL